MIQCTSFPDKGKEVMQGKGAGERERGSVPELIADVMVLSRLDTIVWYNSKQTKNVCV